MQAAGCEFLAGAALAGDQDRDVGGCDALDHLEDRLHRRRRADQRAENAGVAGLAAGNFEFDVRVLLALTVGVLQDGAEAHGVDGLGDVVVRTQAHRLDGGLDGALRGEHDHHHARLQLLDAGEQLHAVHAWHLQVRDHDAGRPLAHTIQAFSAVGGTLGAKAPRRHQLSQPRAGVGFVFHDQYLFGHFHLPYCNFQYPFCGDAGASEAISLIGCGFGANRMPTVASGTRFLRLSLGHVRFACCPA